MIAYDSLFFHSDGLKGLLSDHHDDPLFSIPKLLVTCYYKLLLLNCEKHASSYNPFKSCFHCALEV